MQTHYNLSPYNMHRLIDILNRVKANITDESDMVSSGYDTPQDLIHKIDGMLAEILRGNGHVLDKLSLKFAPTGSLQEHSIDNGWSGEFLRLADEFDEVLVLIRN